MGVWDLIRRSGGKGNNGQTAKGMPPAGAAVPATGDGKTRTNRQVEVDFQPAKPIKRHRK